MGGVAVLQHRGAEDAALGVVRGGAHREVTCQDTTSR